MRRFTQIGLNDALIHQKQENIDSYLNTTWSLEVGRGLLIFAALFVSAPYVAELFGEPRSAALIRVIGLSPVLYGLRNPGVIYFRKNLEYHKQFVYQVSSGVSYFAVGVGYALVRPTVWALVFAILSTDAVKLLLSYYLHDYRPWPSFDRSTARELIDYGKWITGASIIGFLTSEGDDAFVGWFLSATALGFYQYAYRIADMPATEVSDVIAGVMFPTFSKFQDDPGQLRSALLSTTRLIGFITFPMAFGIALVAPSFVRAILGPDWTPMVLTLQLLTIYGILHAVTRNFGSVWKAVGRPDYQMKLGVLRLFCIAALIWPATARWGIEGTAAVVVGVYLFPMLPIDVHLVAKETNASHLEIYREFAYPFVAAATMFGTLWYASGLLSVDPLIEFLLLIPSGAIVYLLTALLLEYQFDWGIEQNLRTIKEGISG